jgi:hypothetical protein
MKPNPLHHKCLYSIVHLEDNDKEYDINTNNNNNNNNE